MTVLFVLLGGAVGAPLRYLTDLAVQARHDSVFPWGTFAVNVSGSLILGGLAAAVTLDGAPAWALTLGGTGLCGALTTWSTFGYESMRLLEDGSWLEAVGNMALSLAAGMAAVAVGWAAVSALG